MTPVRVLIADDQELVRAGFRAILEAAGGIVVVAEAADGVEAVAAAREHELDVALLDIQMPRLDGLDAAEQILAHLPAPRIIMLTTFDLDEHVYRAMRIGACGFLVKDTPREQLIAAVRTVAEGDALLSSTVSRRLVEHFLNSRARTEDHHLPTDRLSPRETDVWHALARGLNNREIAAELYVSEATVKTHVARVLDKLGLRDRGQAIVAAYDTGLVHPRERTAVVNKHSPPRRR